MLVEKLADELAHENGVEAETTAKNMRADSSHTLCCGKRSSSCPPGRERTAVSGPWSFERLNDQSHGEAGIIFSSEKKKLMKRSKSAGGHSNVSVKESKRKKVGGVLSHTMQNLKKVARLPGKDRREVLKILKREVRNRSGKISTKISVEVAQQGRSTSGSSVDSVNKDWENWV
ncbi:DUF4283 domain protein, partial [Trifolium medium]|nr:DUF4283 domain protein [Trifolium medium]